MSIIFWFDCRLFRPRTDPRSRHKFRHGLVEWSWSSSSSLVQGIHSDLCVWVCSWYGSGFTFPSAIGVKVVESGGLFLVGLWPWLSPPPFFAHCRGWSGYTAPRSRYRAAFLSRPHRDLLFRRPSSGIAASGGACQCGRPLPSVFVTAELFGSRQGLSCWWEIDHSCCEACQTGLVLQTVRALSSCESQEKKRIGSRRTLPPIFMKTRSTTGHSRNELAFYLLWHKSKLNMLDHKITFSLATAPVC